MKVFNSTLYRTVFLVILLILFWIWAGLSFTDKINVFFYQQDVRSVISESIETGLNIRSQTNKVIESASPGLHKTESTPISNLEQNIFKLVSNLNFLIEDEAFSNNLSLKRKINTIRENSEEIVRVSNEYIALVKEKGDINQGLVFDITQLFQGEESLSKEFSLYLQNFDPGIIENILESPILRDINSEYIQSDQNTGESPYDILLRDLLRTDYRLGYYGRGDSREAPEVRDRDLYRTQK